MMEHLPNIAGGLMTAAFAIEYLVSRFLLNDNKHETRDSFTALLITIGYVVFSLLRGVMLTAISLWAYDRMPWHWDSYDPVAMLTCFVLVDFFHYWSHRASHAFAFMWAFHAVHHSSRHFNMSLGFRNSWFGGFIDWVFIIPPVFLGFHPLLVAAATAVMSFWDFLCHCPYVGKLPVIDFFFNSPRNHRVHHGVSESDQHCNFGGMLFIWDRMFGTYRAEAVVPAQYGLSPAPERPYNPFYLEFFLLPGLRKLVTPRAKPPGA
jgi:sterol desaturase/sphingolipid hydroxylase (fatty acid hydroxylase superfamily)